ncbi:MAG: SPW repeat protein [Gemmataceae bacterium]|nr:SPW repeat protein [Gemmataceae bacterium]
MPAEHVEHAVTYTCPMHPEVRQDHPGDCPKCGMALVPEEGRNRSAPSEPGGHGEHETAAGDHREMLVRMRAPWLWTNFTVVALGLWLMTAPATFGYGIPTAGVEAVTVERGLAPIAERAAAMTWSDLVSGALLVLFGALSLWPRLPADFFGRWGACLVGVWLQFAPLFLWAPSPAAYVTDTLVGAFVVALTVLVPMMPGMAHHMAMMKPGPEVPPGWTYNPSSWPQRAPIIALGFVGWFISRYLAAVQLGYTGSAWDPFFREGTLRVLHSDVSRSMPISDAGLGAVAYTFEVLMGFMGGPTRWRSMPWMVTFFGILVVPLGVTHVVLVTLQPVVVGEWCTLCLAAAAAMLLMVPLALDEVVAMCQFMVQARRSGKPFWRTFFVGDTVEGGGPDTRTPEYGAPAAAVVPPAVWGVTLPWTLLASTALGVWLLFAPSALGSVGRAADSDHLTGALIVTVAVVATAEVGRAFRFLNVLLGAWLVLAPWVLAGESAAARWSNIAVGVALILLSLPRGPVRDRYGGWDRYVR